MSVVALSYVNLVRTRKQMEQAFASSDWDSLEGWDMLLTQQLNAAFDDPKRDNNVLVAELETILSLYSRVVDCLPEATAQQWMSPELSLS